MRGTCFKSNQIKFINIQHQIKSTQVKKETNEQYKDIKRRGGVKW